MTFSLLPALLGQPFCGRCQRSFGRDDDLRPFNFRSRLGGIAPVAKKHALGIRHEKNAGTACESAEIENVRKMSNQQRIQAMRVREHFADAAGGLGGPFPEKASPEFNN